MVTLSPRPSAPPGPGPGSEETEKRRRKKLPVYIITGASGCGKSRLLEKLVEGENTANNIAIIRHRHARAAMLETSSIPSLWHVERTPETLGKRPEDSHDVGQLNRIAFFSEVFDFGSGCLCCAPGGDLMRQLVRLVEAMVDSDDGSASSNTLHLDVLYLETTGLADPRSFLRVFLEEPLIMQHFELRNVMCVVDVARWESAFGVDAVDGQEGSGNPLNENLGDLLEGELAEILQPDQFQGSPVRSLVSRNQVQLLEADTVWCNEWCDDHSGIQNEDSSADPTIAQTQFIKAFHEENAHARRFPIVGTGEERILKSPPVQLLRSVQEVFRATRGAGEGSVCRRAAGHENLACTDEVCTDTNCAAADCKVDERIPSEGAAVANGLKFVPGTSRPPNTKSEQVTEEVKERLVNAAVNAAEKFNLFQIRREFRAEVLSEFQLPEQKTPQQSSLLQSFQQPALLHDVTFQTVCLCGDRCAAMDLQKHLALLLAQLSSGEVFRAQGWLTLDLALESVGKSADDDGQGGGEVSNANEKQNTGNFSFANFFSLLNESDDEHSRPAKCEPPPQKLKEMKSATHTSLLSHLLAPAVLIDGVGPLPGFLKVGLLDFSRPAPAVAETAEQPSQQSEHPSQQTSTDAFFSSIHRGAFENLEDKRGVGCGGKLFVCGAGLVEKEIREQHSCAPKETGTSSDGSNSSTSQTPTKWDYFDLSLMFEPELVRMRQVLETRFSSSYCEKGKQTSGRWESHGVEFFEMSSVVTSSSFEQLKLRARQLWQRQKETVFEKCALVFEDAQKPIQFRLCATSTDSSESPGPSSQAVQRVLRYSPESDRLEVAVEAASGSTGVSNLAYGVEWVCHGSGLWVRSSK